MRIVDILHIYYDLKLTFFQHIIQRTMDIFI